MYPWTVFEVQIQKRIFEIVIILRSLFSKTASIRPYKNNFLAIFSAHQGFSHRCISSRDILSNGNKQTATRKRIVSLTQIAKKKYRYSTARK